MSNVRLTAKQRAFLQYLRANHGNVVRVEDARAASGLSVASWNVYMNAERYAPYLIAQGADLLVTAEAALTELDYFEQVRQSKTPIGKGKTSAVQQYHALYRLDAKPLGEGGFAQVMRATHKSTGEVVALKRPKRTPSAEERIAREIDVLSSFEHRNIMPVLDFDSSSSWYCMPLAVGSLVVDSTSPRLPDDPRQMVRDIIDGLEYVHAEVGCGHVHRDVSPGNILRVELEGGLRWVISDWGTVKRPTGQTTSLQTRVGELLGTDAFAAPELWTDAHAADWRADIYGLGRVVAWLFGCRLIPNVPAAPKGEWHEFVIQTTQLHRDDRPTSHNEVRALIPGMQ